MDPATPSLDSLVGRLLTLQPDDLPDLNALRQHLGAHAMTLPAESGERVLLEEAIALIISIIMNEADDPAATLAAAADRVGSIRAGAPEPVASDIRPIEREVGDTLPSFEPAPAGSPAAPGTASVPTGSDGHGAPVAVEGVLLPEGGDRDLLPDFLVEGGECLDQAERALLALESAPDDGEAINTVFRAFHTIKGTSAFMGLDLVSAFAHAAESFLARVREHAVPYTPVAADVALRSADCIRGMLQTVDAGLGGAPTPVPPMYAPLVTELRWLAEAPAAVVTARLQRPRESSTGAAAGPAPAPAPAAASRPHPSASDAGSPSGPPAAAGSSSRRGRATEPEQSIRVATGKLDRMIDMVGELVIAQSMVAQDPALRVAARSELAAKVGAAGKIVRELQDLSLSMRMVPLAGAFQKAQRLARDVAAKAGKQVVFVMEGEETEIDRNMVDVINDPLVHMIRNAIDHGIERPDERAAAGKHAAGRVTLSAQHQGGHVVVSLQDDGRGLNRDRIIAKAMQNGLIESEKGLSDADIYNLVFAPGFSTAEVVTDLSGRGVGMDVVKRNIESLHGRVEIDSAPGAGTRFTMRLPLTLAITDGMLARVGSETYIVPLGHITMSFRPSVEMLATVTGRGEMVLLRGELLPMLRLHVLFGIEGAVTDPTQALCMIVSDGDRRVALLVDELLGQSQVVAKPLGVGLFGQTPGIAGGAILGNGTVGLIADVAQMITLARSTSTGTPAE